MVLITYSKCEEKFTKYCPHHVDKNKDSTKLNKRFELKKDKKHALGQRVQVNTSKSMKCQCLGKMKKLCKQWLISPYSGSLLVT